MNTITSRRQNWSQIENSKDKIWTSVVEQFKLKGDRLDEMEDRLKKFRRNRLYVMDLDTEAA